MSKLRERIISASNEQAARLAVPEPEPVIDAEVAALRPEAPPPPPQPRDRLPADVHIKVHRQIIRELGPLLYDEGVDQQQLEQRLQECISQAFAENGVSLSGEFFDQFSQDVRNDVVGYGQIEEFLQDVSVNEIMI